MVVAGWAVVAVTTSAGCGLRAKAIPAVTLRPLQARSLDEVLQAHEQATSAIETLSASGRLEVRDLRAGRQRDFGVRVLAGRGGRLYLKASVAVVTALEAVSDGRTFWLSVPSKRKVWTGDATRPPRIDAAGGAGEPGEYDALRPADLAAALLPEPLALEPGEALLLEGDRESFSLAVGRRVADGRGPARRRVWLEHDTLRPTRSRTYDPEGTLELEATFAEWRDGVPRRVSVARPAVGYEARFTFDKAQANATLPARAFQPRTPADYEVVEVDDRQR
jgi:hypothetical protein